MSEKLNPEFKKKILSSFIRNGCKRRLLLSLYSAKARKELGMPPAQEARSLVGEIGEAGHAWQDKKVLEMGRVFGEVNIIASETWPEERAEKVELEKKLPELRPYQFVVEAEYTSATSAFRAGMGLAHLKDIKGRELGLGTNQPDLIQILPSRKDYPQEEASHFINEVLPNGDLQPIPETDDRPRLRIIDIKMASEPGANYFAEVVYYAITLSAWLAERGHNRKFAVIAASAVWPGSYSDSHVLQTRQKLLADGETPTPELLAVAFEEDLEIAHFETFVTSLRRFFQITLPEVLATPWNQLPIFVNYSCQGCEFMGYPWMKDGVIDHNDRWCWPETERTEHLSLVFGLTRGNARQLGVKTISELAALPPTAPVFQDNPSLRAQSSRFPGRAAALKSKVTGLLADAGSDALMPQWPDLRIFLFLDYDIASAVTITFGLRAEWLEPLPFGSPIPKEKKWRKSWTELSDENFEEVRIVETNNPERERDEFLRFLTALRRILADVIQLDNRARDEGRRDDPRDPGNPLRSTYQIFLWDEAQRRHLQRLVGRHLNAIIRDPNLRDLAWLFPSAELLPRHEQASSISPFTMLARVVYNTVAVPLPHHYTLFGVAQLYHSPDYTPPTIHPLYHDPLSDLIPGERIHELWGKNAKRLTEKQQTILRTTRFKLAAMQVIAEQLQKDLSSELLPTRLAAPTLMERIPPRQLTNEPPFSQLLYEFARLDVSLKELEGYTVRAMPPHEREARFRSAHLTQRLVGEERTTALGHLQKLSPRSLNTIDGLMVYKLSPQSRELNARPGDIGYALSPRLQPDFLLQKPYGLVRMQSAYKIGGPGARRGVATVAQANLTSVSIEAIDRVHGLIAVKLDTTTHIYAAHDPDKIPLSLEDVGLVDLSADVMLDKFEFDGITKKVKHTLLGIGSPTIATHTSAMRRALGRPERVVANPPDPSAAAYFLWAGVTLSTTPIARDLPTIRAVVEPALVTIKRPLNDSQWAAWSNALTKRLTLIWGPPGTGKSQTLRALIAGALTSAQQQNVPLRLLVSANNYTALDTILKGLPKLVAEAIPGIHVDYLRLEGNDRNRPTDLPAEIVFQPVQTKNSDPEVQALQQRLTAPTGLLVVGAIPHQIHNLAIAQPGERRLTDPQLNRATQQNWFDLIIIDEASQMDVASATLVVSKAAENGAFVLAGDDLQLPPIQAAEAPEGLGNYLGSVFSYLRYVQEVEPKSLDINYRSNETLVEFTRRANYSDKLESYSKKLTLDLVPLPKTTPTNWPTSLIWSPNWCHLLNPAHPAAAFTYTDEVSGQANPFEADIVASAVWLLRGHLRRQLLHERQLDGSFYAPTTDLHTSTSFWEKAIGVVTPHKAQMSKIVERLQSIFPHDDPEQIRAAVDTVERFQGQQRDVIIASFGIGDPDLIQSEDEFLFSLRRFNVLASRARAKLIVLAPQSLIDHLPNDAAVLSEAYLLKGYVQSYCNLVAPLELPYQLDGMLEMRSGLLWQR